MMSRLVRRRDQVFAANPHQAGFSEARLAKAAGLTQFGVNLVRLAPGSQTALRHWHEAEDEFVYVLEGTPTLIDDNGPHQLAPGDAAGFGRARRTHTTSSIAV